MNGTAGEPVTFTSQEGLEGLGEPGQYMGVWVRSGNSASQFSHAIFYYGAWGGGYNSGAINAVNGSTVSIDHSRFEYNKDAAVWANEGGTANVSYSTLNRNGWGVSVSGSGTANVDHSMLADNSESGFRTQLATKASSLMFNTIVGNAKGGVFFYAEECSKPLGSFAHGEYNNIYANGTPESPEKQLYALYICEALPVDWRNNYWGAGVYYYRNAPQCASGNHPIPGHLAYTWSHPKYEWEVPKGPLASKASAQVSTKPYWACGWDTFKIGPNEFLTSPVEGAPMPTPDVLFGNPWLFAPNLPIVDCGDPVNCITGNFYETRTDLRVRGLNGGLAFTRTYNSLAAREGTESALGHGWSFEYGQKLELDPSGTAATITNANGARVTFTEEGGVWTAPAWVQATLVKNGDGSFTYTLPSQRSFRFDSSGRLVSLADRNGNATTLSYTEGKLTSVTDPSGRKLTFAYNAAGRIESVTDPAGRKASFGYDEAGNLTSVTDPGETSESYAYDASHELTAMTNPRGGKTTNAYDGSGRVTSQTDPLERKTTWTYHAEDTEVTLPNGAVTKIKFAENLPTEITHAYGTADAATTKYEYDEDLNPVARIDPDGHKTTFGYDAEGNRISRTDAASEETTWTYNSRHEVVSTTTPRGEKTTIARDAAGNPTSISRPAPGEAIQTTTVEYDERGLPKVVTDPLGRTWSLEHDSHGDLTAVSDPLGHRQSMAYDEDSRLTSLVTPRGNLEGENPAEYTIAIERDPRGLPLKVTDPLGEATEYAWDANGNLVARTDAKGHTTKYTYDAGDERTKVEKPDGAVLKTGYDALGHVVSQTDPNGHTTTYVRNLLGRPVEVIDPLERKAAAGYDPAGNLTSFTDAAGRTTTFAYDAANRLTKADYSEATSADVEASYDADSNLTTLVDGSGESTFAYDRLGRLTEARDGHGDLVGYEFDLGEQLEKITYPNGKAVSRSFDGAGRLASVTDWLENTTSFAYDADSDLTATTFPAATGNVDEYAYDRADRISGAQFKGGAESLASLSYVRDKLGQLESLASAGLPGPGELLFGYDEDNRLTKAGEASFEYDLAGNLTKAPGTANTYDAASQLEAGTGLSYAYDKLGERTKATPEAGPATSYGYDQAGDLVSVERPAEGEAPAIDVGYAYDGTGLIASRRSGETTSYLTWDENAPLPLLLGDGQNSYIYGPDGLPVEQISALGTPTYLHHDQLGSTRLITNASGEAVGRFTYSPYGTLEASSGSVTTSLGFAGQYTDPQSGLQYLRERFYDPGTGQFMSRDPIEPLTRQPYSYALDNPLNLTDPSGLLGEEVAVAGAGTCLGTVELPIVGEVACAAAAAAAGTYGVVSIAEATSKALEGSDDENSSAEEVPCLQPPVDPWELETKVGDRGQEMTKAQQQVAQERISGETNPEAPGPSGSPTAKAVKVAALLAALYESLHHH